MVMKQNQKIAIIFTVLLLSSVMVLFINTNLQVSSVSPESRNYYDGGSLKTAAVLTDFLIDDTGSDNWTWAKINGYCTGLGTPGSPYLIANQIFEYSSGGGNSLTIVNSRKYFILRNCTFRNALTSFFGLYLDNLTNGLIDNSFVYNTTGIFMNNVNDTEVRNSHIHDNANDG
ncbi:MAG: right-handed parallel beta-helix repeat-containing protein, partial [Promethearchaeota archaeon]